MTTIRAGLYGLIVADALGVPAESRTREDLRRNPIIEMVGGGLHHQNKRIRTLRNMVQRRIPSGYINKNWRVCLLQLRTSYGNHNSRQCKQN